MESGALVVTQGSRWIFLASTEFKLPVWNRVSRLLQGPSFGIFFLQSGKSLVLNWDKNVDARIIGYNETKLGKPWVSTWAALLHELISGRINVTLFTVLTPDRLETAC